MSHCEGQCSRADEAQEAGRVSEERIVENVFLRSVDIASRVGRRHIVEGFVYSTAATGEGGRRSSRESKRNYQGLRQADLLFHLCGILDDRQEDTGESQLTCATEECERKRKRGARPRIWLTFCSKLCSATKTHQHEVLILRACS